MVFKGAALAAGIILSSSAWADDETPPVVDGRTYVQHQVEVARALHPEIRSIVVSGKREHDDTPVVFGDSGDRRHVFSPRSAGGKDGQVIVSGRCSDRLPYLSSTGHRLGRIEIDFNRGVAPATCSRVAAAVQSRLKRDSLSLKNAIDPYPFDPAWGPGTYAQSLTERTIAKHPDLLVMMIHATPPGMRDNIIIGSNIGRFGKKADEDDLRVIEQGSTNLEIGGDNDRFETELPLNDAAGRRIGALGLVFDFKAGQDKEAIHRHGLAIRDEIAREIPNSGTLFRRDH